MLAAVFSDIHANLEAFTAVFDAALSRGADRFWCLGDVVGYGGDPNACVDLARRWCPVTVLGNHDAAVLDDAEIDLLPTSGQDAIADHRQRLGTAQVAWLSGLPVKATVENATLVHAAPSEPNLWPRLESMTATRDQFEYFDTAICFVGHSHRPSVASASLGVFRVRRGHRFLINVGSVGQPRDGDPRASFGLFDTDAMTYENVRVDYDVERAANKIRDAGLPASLADRLQRGV
ncbi:MAG: metallophosphoesterase family protein [Bacteroidota bacterium]